ncbi:phage baseplate protein [Amycolatopsis sp. MEPSY49]|uniref:phage baseplate protein n=1 Tax=Amycolatopsis sp. MEPSY49 TaxID=3151600 RepID=UPI003EFADE68
MLHESHHVMQGFAFDNVNRRLFVQAQNGTSGDDLCVNQLGFSGELLGSTHLAHAGHGVAIGVAPVGTSRSPRSARKALSSRATPSSATTCTHWTDRGTPTPRTSTPT